MDVSGAPLRRNPEYAGKTLTFSSTPIDVRRKWVGQWNFLLGCVSLGHRKVRNQSLPQINTRFLPVRPKGEFSPLSVQELTREKVKPVTPRSRIPDIYNTQHTCIHMVWHNLGLGGVPTLRGPASAKP